MSYQLLLGGYRKSFALASFEPSTAKLKLTSESPAPNNASWIEPPAAAAAKASTGGKVFYSLAEDEDKGLAVSLKLKDDKVEITAQRDVPAAPAHIHSLKDGSGVVYTTYMGGTATFFPTDPASHALSSDSKSPHLHFPFVYEGKKAPRPDRQEASHPHQAVEGENGVLYIPDLGSDRIWTVEREGESGLKITGYLQCPEGAGPRHVALSFDGKHLYALTELSHAVLAWSLSGDAPSIHPLPKFEASIIPPSAPLSHSKYMDSAELCINSAYPRTLFASNRLELAIFDNQPELPKLPDYPPTGDAVTIFLLSEDGNTVEDTKYIRTGCNSVRGMNLSPDGKFVALAGQNGGGVEIYKISGERGDEWKLAAKDESIEKVTTVVWIDAIN